MPVFQQSNHNQKYLQEKSMHIFHYIQNKTLSQYHQSNYQLKNQQHKITSICIFQNKQIQTFLDTIQFLCPARSRPCLNTIIFLDRLACSLTQFSFISTQMIIIFYVEYMSSYLRIYKVNPLNTLKITRAFVIQLMSKSKSPKKGGVEEVAADPDARERARKAQAERSKKKEDLLDKYAYHIVFGVLIVLVLVAVVNSLWKSGPDVYTTDVNDAAYIQSLNSAGYTFKAAPNKMFEGYKLVDAKRTINVQASNKPQLYKCNSDNKDTIVPETYNFREQYPNCARPIATQGNCSSSYSIASISAITDRWCRNNELEYPVLSPHTPVFCDKAINSNCKGGILSRTLDYAKMYGLVDVECAAYDAASEEKEQQCIERVKECKRYNIGDYCVSSESENIKKEIANYGPVIVTIPIYRDFLVYSSGLYQVYPKNQRFSAEHAVKIIGWDIIDGQNCWLIENSWGEEWGQNGTACVVADSEELHIERFTLAVALNNEETEQEQEKEEFIDEILDEETAPESEIDL